MLQSVFEGLKKGDLNHIPSKLCGEKDENSAKTREKGKKNVSLCLF